MTLFHRFYSLFPVFLTLALTLFMLVGCTGTSSKPVWSNNQTQNAPAIGAVPMAARPAQQAGVSTKVAILLPLSGSNAALGQSMLQAAQLAVFDTGYDNFELMPFDTAGTPGGAAMAASSALSKGAQIILGPLFAEEVRSVKTATSGQNINIIAFSTDWTLAGGNTFIMGFLPFGQVDRIAAYAAARGLKNTVILSGQDTYGLSASSAFEQSARRYGLAANRAAAPLPSHDSVFIPAGGQSLASLAAKTPPTLRKLGTGLWDDDRLATSPYMNGAWFAAPSPSLRAGFETKYKSTYGSAPIRIASLAYDATALSVALGKLGQTRGTVPAFDAQSLTNPAGFAGIDGIVRFQTNGMAERGLAVLEFRGGRMVEIDPAPKRF